VQLPGCPDQPVIGLSLRIYAGFKGVGADDGTEDGCISCESVDLSIVAFGASNSVAGICRRCLCFDKN
jgi:hypothetical protein